MRPWLHVLNTQPPRIAIFLKYFSAPFPRHLTKLSIPTYACSIHADLQFQNHQISPGSLICAKPSWYNPTTRKFLFRCSRPSCTNPGSRTETRPPKSKREKKETNFLWSPPCCVNRQIRIWCAHVLQCAVRWCGWVEGPYRRPQTLSGVLALSIHACFPGMSEVRRSKNLELSRIT